MYELRKCCHKQILLLFVKRNHICTVENERNNTVIKRIWLSNTRNPDVAVIFEIRKIHFSARPSINYSPWLLLLIHLFRS